MANIFTLENFNDFSEKINIDELYEKKKQHDLNKLELFKKILNRVHIRIKTVSRQSIQDKFCWFVVPEIIIGVPKYDQAGCITYIMDALDNNGFKVRFFYPNTLFISWEHWVPTYIRNEIKKKTGVVVNEYGEKIDNEQHYDDEDNEEETLTKDTPQQINNSKKYTPINSYKPSGKLLYSNEILDKIGNKFN
jgi:hypothetical protein